MKKNIIILSIIIIGLLVVRTILLKKPSTEIRYTVKKEDLIETIRVSGTFNKTAKEEEKALAYVTYQNALNALVVSQQSKPASDATMWTKQKALLDAQNAVDYKNNNITNPTTKKDYTDLERYSIDSALTQAQKDFTASELKYKESDIAIGAAYAQVSLAKITYDDMFLNEPLMTIDINEVYLPRISVGQKAIILFDASTKKVLTGTVKSIDTIGMDKGGIVTYEVKVSIDTIPQEIKPNMTAIITIETERKNNVLLVPNSALILKDEKQHVQVMGKKGIVFTEVVVGIEGIVKTEIINGLDEGAEIVANPTDK
jgi:hypothetical protein